MVSSSSGQTNVCIKNKHNNIGLERKNNNVVEYPEYDEYSEYGKMYVNYKIFFRFVLAFNPVRSTRFFGFEKITINLAA